MFGGTGNDLVFGGTEADHLDGDAGRDQLDGGLGDDAIVGESGADTLIGGGGADQMTGGTEADIFVFGALTDMGLGITRDFILDFTSGSDTLNFHGLGLTFVGGGAFTGANQLRYDAATHLAQIDSDGDLVADLEIELQAGATVLAGDLILV